MAQKGTTTPNQGREWGLLTLGIMVAIFFGMSVAGYLIAGSLEADPAVAYAVAASRPDAGATAEATGTPEGNVDDHPAVEDGTGAWEAWAAKAAENPEMIGAMTDTRLHPTFSPTQLEELINLERAGWDFLVWVPKGTIVVNTGYRNGKYFVTKPYALTEGRWGLVDKDGYLHVLESCGNASRVIKLGPPEKPTKPVPPRPRRGKPLRNDDPSGKYTPHHPGNDTYYYPRDPGRTPGANLPEVIEEIAEEQESEVNGGREPTEHGTDSGQETNTETNSETTNPDGTKEEAEIGEEVEEKAPTEEVVEGEIDPDAVK